MASSEATNASLAYQYGGNHKGGWLAYLPEEWLPYVQLARLSPPVGLFLVFIPHAFGILHAAIRNQSAPLDVARASGLLFAASFFYSNAVHIWNDLIDAPIDSKVQRTRKRPIPRRAVSPRAAFLFAASQALVTGSFLFFMEGNLVENCLYAVPGIISWTYYPYAKLHTFWTQAVLGFALSWGVVMGSISLGLRPVAYKAGQVDFATIVLFTASICWTMIYDSVYAYQDLADDLQIGVGSMAVLFRYQIKPIFWSLVAVITVCLGILGRWEEMSPVYYILVPGGTTLWLGLMVTNVNLADSGSCWWWFSNGFWGVGGFIVVGLLLEYLRIIRFWN
ncbi:UbiA prenyltransferase family-domain-containing protein [Dendryphion nanum]|uniref:UbiA prenyltransferase family-domain-containing protein n=1 Tax=Dendryphion nanum TaxID=256645 RepID=A0A9P9CZD1_9PLEO|nr:UbiA prenyltransferase family-domain-containing protein [Dendryphion nanum]